MVRGRSVTTAWVLLILGSLVQLELRVLKTLDIYILNATGISVDYFVLFLSKFTLKAKAKHLSSNTSHTSINQSIL